MPGIQIGKQAHLLLAAALGLVIIMEYYLSVPALAMVGAELKVWAVVVAYFSAILGMVYAGIYHWEQIRKRVKGQWYYSVYFIALTLLMFFVGVFVSDQNVIYKWIFDKMYMPTRTAIYGSTVFYVFSAAFRAFKVKNIEAFLLVLSAFIVMMGSIPIGAVIWPGSQMHPHGS